ncbi:hypothetical protein SEA_YABOI_232 [Streptomyces phage Yaboi]|jgi:Txe/YoeB family toxin of Txe-Axe toxin-antitoxin module|uniref:Uncharacterized protein n=3 Tax=Streptomyces virus Yaboi TaxID=2846408 RepID=A0A385UIL9_9CAUD|nr:hypothetical protein HWB86_gp094 [Streptomyces phage Yaboi]QAY08849.1 hypothetical protein SEA_GENIE2_227 [Streptomyces phage Genie2]QAY12839.1 hypothetical protein SEA_BOOMERJR_227 [Streptomyces phage BoomerJR]UVD40033.1 hypothetical protein SEA_STANIMAL_227 [Streptomyces phage Stanimal]WNM73775.1 hypothetical protein SEA_SOLLERTIA_228 [Streptomyces phage Sollertia]AYB71025.1 hypothetical protein SEA_YABOI_232 [Streptomyces phage Yaboi]
MRYSELRVDMPIKHIKTKRTAIVAEIKSGKFKIVDNKGKTETLDRYYAGEWERNG